MEENNEKRNRASQIGANYHFMLHSVFGALGMTDLFHDLSVKEERPVEDVGYEEVYPVQLPPVSMSLRFEQANDHVKMNSLCKWLTYITDLRLEVTYQHVHGLLNSSTIDNLMEGDNYMNTVDLYTSELFKDIGIQYYLKEVFDDVLNRITTGNSGFDRVMSYLEDVHANYMTRLQLVLGVDEPLTYNAYSKYDDKIAL